MLELVLAVHSCHVIAYPDFEVLKSMQASDFIVACVTFECHDINTGLTISRFNIPHTNFPCKTSIGRRVKVLTIILR